MRKVRITNLEHERSERTVFVHQTDGDIIEVRPGREAVVDFAMMVLVADRKNPEDVTAEGATGMPAANDDTPPPNGEKPAQLYTEAELLNMTNAELESMGGEGRVKAELVASILKQQEEAVAAGSKDVEPAQTFDGGA